jgi:hypothetical protein
MNSLPAPLRISKDATGRYRSVPKPKPRARRFSFIRPFGLGRESRGRREQGLTVQALRVDGQRPSRGELAHQLAKLRDRRGGAA